MSLCQLNADDMLLEATEKWEDEAAEVVAAEDADMEEEEEEEEETFPTPVAVQATSGPKKEHVNVVFIGHVGKNWDWHSKTPFPYLIIENGVLAVYVLHIWITLKEETQEFSC